jgi:Kef-type K+ transport system membrane component KefB
MACSAFDDPQTLADLSNLGVLFLLFEMGLELSTDRLRALSRYAFGLGTIQVFATTLAFVLFAVPFGKSLGTLLLQKLAFADVQISSINTWDEALVIAVSLSLSSSAFVLQILGDKGQLASRSGSATLGILLLQVLTPHMSNMPTHATGSCTLFWGSTSTEFELVELHACKTLESLTIAVSLSFSSSAFVL